jgi:hypothetical protein
VSATDFLRADLEDAWAAACAIPGPELGDRSVPLADRCAVFGVRLAEFRRVMAAHEHPEGEHPDAR